jgi:anaerobic magnesium-protoporphyrin IX monomethyl ester cyclase
MCYRGGMRVALVYPPTCDPTAPYLAVPMLTGFLRANGVEVLPIDANIEAFDDLFEPGPLRALAGRLDGRLRELDRRGSLGHEEQLEYAAIVRALGDAHAVPNGILRAKRALRDEASFFDPVEYASAVATIEAALRAVSAACFPLHLDFTAYRTPLGMTSMDEIARAGDPSLDPFDAYVESTLIPRLAASRADVVGLSVCFPGQLQPAYSFAQKIKRALPHIHLTCGGPGITQMMVRLSGTRLANALGPFDSACLYEGEHTLLALVRAVAEKTSLREVPNVVLRDRLLGARVSSGHGMIDLRDLPAPDFDGMPLERYLSPRLVLPYDPTRGCYWGKCTFCHYGLAEVGTATYRERDVARAVEHLRALSERHATRYFYLSQDSVAPKTLVKLSQAMIDAGLSLRWATDLKPEKYFTPERAETLRRAGAVACALGVESASPRVLRLIDKGAPPSVVSDVIDRLADAGVAAEAMCFTDFPTESYDEAISTLEFLHQRKDRVAMFIVGEFGLTHGSLVAQDPAKFGIEETWEVEGDELGLGIFFQPTRPWKTDDERSLVDERLTDLSSDWTLRSYPWAGAVSTAHTILHYDRYGMGAFRDPARRAPGTVHGAKRMVRSLRFDPERAARAEEHEGTIWATLVYDERRIGREAYEEHASMLPRMRARPVKVVLQAGQEPAFAVSRRAPGRRPSHATSSAG